MLRASIKRCPLPSAPWLLIAIAFPRWFPTHAALGQLHNRPLEEWCNGVTRVCAVDKANVSSLTARFPSLLPGTF